MPLIADLKDCDVPSVFGNGALGLNQLIDAALDQSGNNQIVLLGPVFGAGRLRPGIPGREFRGQYTQFVDVVSVGCPPDC